MGGKELELSFYCSFNNFPLTILVSESVLCIKRRCMDNTFLKEFFKFTMDFFDMLYVKIEAMGTEMSPILG